MVNPNILEELRPFFYPRSIAVVGVSHDRAKFGSSQLSAFRRFGFKGRLYPVGQGGVTFQGLEGYASVTDIPEDVDLACICLPAPRVPAAVQECKAKNIPAVIVLSSGFSESGRAEAKQLEAELTRLSGNGLRILGPNCFGIYSPGGGVTMIPGPYFPHESGSVGLLSQSGGVSVEFSRLSSAYGIKPSQVVSYGNACDITELQLLHYFEADPRTLIVAIYIEGARRGREFFDSARRLALKKPLIILKGGNTPAGAQAAASHTASLAGSETAWTALFRQTGAIQVHSLEELMDTASALSNMPPQKDPRVAFVCGGGGFAVAASDNCYREGLIMPALSQKLQQKLVTILAPVGTSPTNPVDTGNPFPPTAMLQGILDGIASSGEVGSIIIQNSLSSKMHQFFDAAESVDNEADEGLTEVPVKFKKRWGMPIMLVLREAGDPGGAISWEDERGRLRRYYNENGIAVYPTVERAIKALGRVVSYYQWREKAQGTQALSRIKI
ncbi:CoA-binding protein [bacterium]|nr:CoA-binding protein [bacterium]